MRYRGAILAFAIALVLSLIWHGAARSHDWFVGMRDPVSGDSCCDGPDASQRHCNAVPAAMMKAGVITEVANGYHVRLTGLQANYFNPHANKAIDQIIPWSRAQPGMANGFALCVVANEIRCFMTASNS